MNEHVQKVSDENEVITVAYLDDQLGDKPRPKLCGPRMGKNLRAHALNFVDDGVITEAEIEGSTLASVLEFAAEETRFRRYSGTSIQEWVTPQSKVVTQFMNMKATLLETSGGTKLINISQTTFYPGMTNRIVHKVHKNSQCIVRTNMIGSGGVLLPNGTHTNSFVLDHSCVRGAASVQIRRQDIVSIDVNIDSIMTIEFEYNGTWTWCGCRRGETFVG